MDKQREEFEAWVREYGNHPRRPELRSSDGSYHYLHTESEWRAWQAAQAAQPTQPRLKVRLTAFPESNGKRNSTALLVRFDIGDFDDDEPKRSHKKPVYKRVKCPHCDKHPKERGLADHIRDVHRISKVKQAINSQGIPTPSNLTPKDDL